MILWFREGLSGVSGERLGAEDPPISLHRRWCGRGGERSSSISRWELGRAAGALVSFLLCWPQRLETRADFVEVLLQSPLC